MRRVAFWSTLLLTLGLAGEVWQFPTNAWRQARLETGARHAVVKSAQGQVLLTVDASAAHPSLEGVALALEPDGLVLDVSEARRKGLKTLVLRVPVAAEGLDGTAVTHLADWRGAAASEMDVYCEGRFDGRHFHQSRRVVFGERRRLFAQVSAVPGGLSGLTLRYDLVTFAGTGVFKYFGSRVGRNAELPLPCGTPQDGPVRQVFAASFDGNAQAQTESGAVGPLVAENLEFAPGIQGQAVRLSAAARSCLAYAMPARLSTAAGTVSMWIKREWANPAGWRSLFGFPQSGQRCGNGQIWLWWWDSKLRFDAADDARAWQCRNLPVDAHWHHVAATWTDEGYRFYFDGRCLYDSRRDAYADSTSPILRAIKGVFLDRQTYDRIAPDRFFVGCQARQRQFDGLIDDVRIWNGALDEARIVALSLAHGRVARPAPVDYAQVFARSGGNPVGRTDPAPLDLELVESIPLDRDGVGRLTAARRFRAVGDFGYGKLDAVDYLACGPRKNDRVAIRFAVDPKDPLYVIDVDYPDDAKRTADVIVQGTDVRREAGAAGPDYALQVGYFCGDELPNSNRIQTHRCLYWTCDRDCALILTTARENAPAAASALRIYRVKDAKLPALAVAEPPPVDGWNRTFALYYEDPAIGYDFATRRTSGHDLDELEKMIDRTAAYMKYCGQNLFCYPGVWYQGRIGADRYNPRGHAERFLEAWYAKFDREGLFVVPNVNPNNMPIPDGVLNTASLLDGSLHASPIAIHDTGRPNWGGWHNTPPNFCIGHPDVRRFIEENVDALVEQGASHPSFKGVCLHLTMHCMLWWGDLRSGYNDYVVEAFERDTGVKVPRPAKTDDPLRGRSHAAWLRAHAYPAWVQWRCDQVTKFYAHLAGKLRARRPDLKLWLNSFIQPDFRQDDFTQAGFMERQAREAGLDRAALNRIPNLILCQTAYPSFVRKRERELFPSDAAFAFNRVLQHQKSYNALLEGAAYPWVQLFDLYWENPVGREENGLSCDWLKECSWRVTTLNPGGVHALRDFVIPLRHRDVLGFSKGGFLVGTYGMEEHLRRFARAFRALPAVPMQDVPGAGDELVRVRAAVHRGRTYVYAVNTDCRPRDVSWTFPADCRDLVSGELHSGPRTLSLRPYELRSFGAGRTDLPAE
ncbi:MAG: LamG-like jellyroll fold domain-containing protein [Kiritimatiellia bacterium]